MIRAFLAIELSPPLRAAITTVQDELKRRVGRDASEEARVAWVTPASIHLTVRFLGDMEDGLIHPLQEAVARAVAETAAAVVPIERIGVFPRPQAPRVIWLGPEAAWEHGAPGHLVRKMQQAIDECCVGLGFASDTKGFSPHLTVARVKAGERQVGQALARSGMLDRAVPVGTLEVGSLVLMKSELRPTGSLYTRLWEVKLGPGGPASS